MKIKKLGHCCLVIETKGKRILTDPGVFTNTQDEEKNIDIVLITHEHADHFHVPSVKKIIENNPNAIVVTNSAVGELLKREGISFELLEHGAQATWCGIDFEACGDKHAEIYREFGQVQNTGYFVDGALFYPGDAFTLPGKAVDILALPVAGPWMKISEAIEYALAVKPNIAFPVHDAIMKDPSMMQGMVGKILTDRGIHFEEMNAGDEHEF